MRKIILLTVLIFSIGSLFSQENNKGGFFLRSSINYFYQHKDRNDIEITEDYTIPLGLITSDFGFGVNVARKSKSGIYYGLGYAYNYSKEIINPESDLPDLKLPNGSGGGVYHSVRSYTTIKNTNSPVIFVGYNKYLLGKLSFSIEFYTKYGFTNSKNIQDTYIPKAISYFPIVMEYQKTTTETDDKIQSIELGLLPSIRYDFTKKIGLELAFGNLHYFKKIKDTGTFEVNSNSSQIKASFKPIDWRLSFYLQF